MEEEEEEKGIAFRCLSLTDHQFPFISLENGTIGFKCGALGSPFVHLLGHLINEWQ